MSFINLGLHEALLKAVADSGYDTATEVQLQAILYSFGLGSWSVMPSRRSTAFRVFETTLCFPIHRPSSLVSHVALHRQRRKAVANPTAAQASLMDGYTGRGLVERV